MCAVNFMPGTESQQRDFFNSKFFCFFFHLVVIETGHSQNEIRILER